MNIHNKYRIYQQLSIVKIDLAFLKFEGISLFGLMDVEAVGIVD